MDEELASDLERPLSSSGILTVKIKLLFYLFTVSCPFLPIQILATFFLHLDTQCSFHKFLPWWALVLLGSMVEYCPHSVHSFVFHAYRILTAQFCEFLN